MMRRGCILLIAIALFLSACTHPADLITGNAAMDTGSVIRTSSSQFIPPEDVERSYSVEKEVERTIIEEEISDELGIRTEEKKEINIHIGDDFDIDGVQCLAVSLGYKSCIRDDNVLKVYIRNGLTNVSGIYFSIYYNLNSSVVKTFDKDLNIKEVMIYEINLEEFALDFDMVEKIEVIPIIKINETLKMCYNKKLHFSPFSCKSED